MSSPMLMKIGQFDRRDVCCLYKIVLFVEDHTCSSASGHKVTTVE